ncbi:MAG TPA: hypothetical protein VGI05_18230, partial [Streptosporangiaceae bacterium]
MSPQGDASPLRRGPLRHPGGGDRLRPAARRLQPKVEFQLPGRDPLPRRRLQRLQFRLIVRHPRCSISRTANLKVSAASSPRTRDREPSQDERCPQRMTPEDEQRHDPKAAPTWKKTF